MRAPEKGVPYLEKLHMKPFLTQVAGHYAGKDLTRTLFVLPTRRAGLYFEKSLHEAQQGPFFSSCHRMSFNDFAFALDGHKAADRVTLLMALHHCWMQIGGRNQDLEAFIGLGETILQDFNNIDRYALPAKNVFVTTADIRNMRDPMDYLTPVQAKALERLAGRDGGMMQERFHGMWDLLYPLYQSFHQYLVENDLRTEGLAVREAAAVAARPDGLAEAFPSTDKVVFIGFANPDPSQKAVMKAIFDRGMAEFVWESPEDAPDGLPTTFTPDTSHQEWPDVRVIAVPSFTAQAKLADHILRQCDGESERTAFILPDDGLLPPLLSALPEEAQVNVTMGYPLHRSAVASLLRSASETQLGARTVDGMLYFHHKATSDLLRNPLLHGVLDMEARAAAADVLKDAKADIPSTDIARGPVLSKVFQDVIAGRTDDAAVCGDLARYLQEIIMTIGRRLGDSDDETMEKIISKRCYEIIGQLAEKNLPLRPAAWLSLLWKLIRTDTVPFDGEPLRGIQVMGTLEARLLGFRNIAILGANDDTFPGKSAEKSIIPVEVRNAYGLPTPQSVAADRQRLFYRLIRGAEKVWITYDSRTEGIQSGEETRFVKQLEYLYNVPVKRFSAAAPMNPVNHYGAIEKTPEDIQALREGHLSASALQDYLVCPAKFYYQSVKGLRENNAASDDLDAAMLGTAFHRVMEGLYRGKTTVTRTDVLALIDNEDDLRVRIKDAIREQTRSATLQGRNIVMEEVILQYVKAALRTDLQAMTNHRTDSMRIIGLERSVRKEIDGFPFIGFIDRIDTFGDGNVRIVDYKTGHVEDDDILINDANAQKICEKLFGESNYGRPKIALQLYLYDEMAREGIVRGDETIINSIYSTARMLTRPLPDVPESLAFRAAATDGVRSLLSQISDINTPWMRTEDNTSCQWCPFKDICGR